MELKSRLNLPFDLLSDVDLNFTKALNLPTFVVGDVVLLKRMALVIKDGVIVKVFYPCFPPDKNAEEVLEWVRNNLI